jgi:uncharacterized membrane protein
MTDVIRKSITVNKNVSDVYSLWQDFENFPQFMKNIRSVEKTGDQTSHWVADGPMGKKVEWDAVTTTLEPNKRIAWRSTEGDLDTEGQVMFNAVSPERTEVSVMMSYDAMGEKIAKLIENPEGQVEEDLQNFKRFAEGRGTMESRDL